MSAPAPVIKNPIIEFFNAQEPLPRTANYAELKTTAKKIHTFLLVHKEEIRKIYGESGEKQDAIKIFEQLKVMINLFEHRRVKICRDSLVATSMEIDLAANPKLTIADQSALKLQKKLALDYIISRLTTTQLTMDDLLAGQVPSQHKEQVAHILATMQEECEIQISFCFRNHYPVENFLSYARNIRENLAMKTMESKTCIIL